MNYFIYILRKCYFCCCGYYFVLLVDIFFFLFRSMFFIIIGVFGKVKDVCKFGIGDDVFIGVNGGVWRLFGEDLLIFLLIIFCIRLLIEL